jgi:hypothetical protein
VWAGDEVWMAWAEAGGGSRSDQVVGQERHGAGPPSLNRAVVLNGLPAWEQAAKVAFTKAGLDDPSGRFLAGILFRSGQLRARR